MKRISLKRLGYYLMITSFLHVQAIHGELSPDIKSKVEKKISELRQIGSDQKVISALLDYNTNPPSEVNSMTNDKWKDLAVISPEVKKYAKNELMTHLKTNLDPAISELFISGASGTKVAFLTKPTSWSHKGKPKHDKPMAGQVWIGDVEIDESTGIQQIQISFPVLDGKKPIGSIVIGLNLSKI